VPLLLRRLRLRALRRASWHGVVIAAGMGSGGGELDCEHAGSREREPERQFELFHCGSPLFLVSGTLKGPWFNNLGFHISKNAAIGAPGPKD